MIIESNQQWNPWILCSIASSKVTLLFPEMLIFASVI
jgi:hypothetical protein